MNNQTLLSQPIFQALGWALIHFIWQGALVALLYASARVVLHRRSANVRYATASFAMLLMLALPITTTLLINRSLSSKPQTAQGISSNSSTDWKSNVAPDDVASSQAIQATWTATSTSSVSISTPTLSQRLTGLLPWLVSVWLACVLILSLRVMGGWIKAQQLKNWKTTPAAERWQEMLIHLTRRLRISRTVRLCESIVAEVPTVIGWIRPVILVPVSAFVGLSPQQIEAILAHELAHIRRYDYFVNLLQTAIETLLFYHPAVWWVSRQVRTEREHCCDDIAVELCGNVLTYARALAELEELRGFRVMPQLAVAADGGGSLLKRIQRLVETPKVQHQRSSAWLASALAIATIFTICVGARTTLFKSDVESNQTNSSRAAVFENKSRLTVPASAQLRFGDSQEDVQVVLPQIEANVSVMASLPDGSAAVPPVVSIGQSDATSPVTAFSWQYVPSPIAPAAPVAPVLAFTFVRVPNPATAPSAQDDEDAPSSSYVDALAAVGYTNLTVDQMIEMRNHGVSAGFVTELKALGYPLPSIDMAIRLVDHGVSIKFIKSLGDVGYKNLSFDALIRAKDHGVRSDVIEAFNSSGHTNLSLDHVIRAVDHGVGPAFIKAMSEVGFNKLSLDLLIRLKDHGVDPGYIKEIRSLGYDSASPEQFIRLRDHGITAAFLRKARERGFNNLSLDELVRLRDADIL